MTKVERIREGNRGKTELWVSGCGSQSERNPPRPDICFYGRGDFPIHNSFDTPPRSRGRVSFSKFSKTAQKGAKFAEREKKKNVEGPPTALLPVAKPSS